MRPACVAGRPQQRRLDVHHAQVDSGSADQLRPSAPGSAPAGRAGTPSAAPRDRRSCRWMVSGLRVAHAGRHHLEQLGAAGRPARSAAGPAAATGSATTAAAADSAVVAACGLVEVAPVGARAHQLRFAEGEGGFEHGIDCQRCASAAFVILTAVHGLCRLASASTRWCTACAPARIQRRQKRGVLRGGEVDAHQRASAAAWRGTARPGAISQPSSSSACGQRSVSHAGVDPAEQARAAARRSGSRGLARQPHGARARRVQRAHHALGMAAQQALLQAHAPPPAPAAPGVVSVRSSLVSMKRSTSAGGAAMKPTRQCGVRIFEKPET